MCTSFTLISGITSLPFGWIILLGFFSLEYMCMECAMSVGLKPGILLTILNYFKKCVVLKGYHVFWKYYNYILTLYTDFKSSKY